MSIYKGTQLIAANGAPGQNGRDGIDGGGVVLVPVCTELHNMIDADGVNRGTNSVNSSASWCTVEGYDCSIGPNTSHSQVRGSSCSLSAGLGAQVEGYRVFVEQGDEGVHAEGHSNDIRTATIGSHTEGYNNLVNNGAGGHIEGFDSVIKAVGNGVHIEGAKHGWRTSGEAEFAHGLDIDGKQGLHIEGYGHRGNLSLTYSLSDGAHVGGYGLDDNSRTITMPAHRTGYESTNIEVIGLKSGGVARITANDGSMGIAGDLAFTALDSNGDVITNGSNPDGRYTLGEIVEALIQAGILTPPL